MPSLSLYNRWKNSFDSCQFHPTHSPSQLGMQMTADWGNDHGTTRPRRLVAGLSLKCAPPRSLQRSLQALGLSSIGTLHPDIQQTPKQDRHVFVSQYRMVCMSTHRALDLWRKERTRIVRVSQATVEPRYGGAFRKYPLAPSTLKHSATLAHP